MKHFYLFLNKEVNSKYIHLYSYFLGLIKQIYKSKCKFILQNE